jgi:hypothetical protein
MNLSYYINEIFPFVLIAAFILVPIDLILMGINLLSTDEMLKAIMLIIVGGIMLLAEIIIGISSWLRMG